MLYGCLRRKGKVVQLLELLKGRNIYIEIDRYVYKPG